MLLKCLQEIPVNEPHVVLLSVFSDADLGVVAVKFEIGHRDPEDYKFCIDRECRGISKKRGRSGS